MDPISMLGLGRSGAAAGGGGAFALAVAGPGGPAAFASTGLHDGFRPSGDMCDEAMDPFTQRMMQQMMFLMGFMMGRMLAGMLGGGMGQRPGCCCGMPGVGSPGGFGVPGGGFPGGGIPGGGFPGGGFPGGGFPGGGIPGGGFPGGGFPGGGFPGGGFPGVPSFPGMGAPGGAGTPGVYGPPTIGGTQTPFNGGVVSPLDRYRITDNYGKNRGGGEVHRGIDLAAYTGNPIKAAMDGTISKVGWDPKGYGNWVEIQHPNGMSTRYGHMSKFANIREGQRVGAGSVIGAVGSTGRSTGPHLLFELRNQAGQPMDPNQLIPFRSNL